MINFREIYEETDKIVQEYEKVELYVTLTNSHILSSVVHILVDGFNGEPFDLKIVVMQMAALMHVIQRRLPDLTYDALVSKFVEVRDAVLENFDETDNTVQDLCYIIGTSSETDNNYTVTEKFGIYLAILELLGVQVQF